MMTRQTVQDAINEAKRFIDRAQTLLDTEVTEWDYKTQTTKKKRWEHTSDAPMRQGAVRRASMDLSRALSALRSRR